MSLVKIYKKIARILPKGYREYIERKLVCSGLAIRPDIFIGFLFLFNFIISFIIGFALFLFGIVDLLYFLLITFSVFCLILFIVHVVLIWNAYRKALFVEEILPDALQLMAANIRAGITPDRALLLSARPEFGPLEIEIKRAAKEALTGKPLEEALMEIPKRIESKILLRTMKLIAEGLRSGGELATLLDETANDVRQTQSIRKEIKANVTMYGMFIFFATAFGAPLLYAISTYLVEMIVKFGVAVVVPPGMEVGPLRFSAPTISPQFLFNFSIAAIIITTSFGGIIVGLIETGREKAGLRFIFFLIAIGLAVFFAVRIFLRQAFGTL